MCLSLVGRLQPVVVILPYQRETIAPVYPFVRVYSACNAFANLVNNVMVSGALVSSVVVSSVVVSSVMVSILWLVVLWLVAR